MKNTLYLLIIIILILFIFWNNQKERLVYETKIDTLIQIEQDTIDIIKRGNIRYVKDTIILTKPFESRLDTNIKNKILKISYSYPENNFDFQLSEKDTLRFIQERTVNQKENNWIQIILGILIGIIIGLL